MATIEVQKKIADTVPWQEIRAGQIAFRILDNACRNNGQHGLAEFLDRYRTSAMIVYSPVRETNADGTAVGDSLEIIRAGKQAFDLGVETHLGLALQVAGQFSRIYTNPVIDNGYHASLAVEGLMRVVARYDPSQAEFCTYAGSRIRGMIIDGIRQLQPGWRNNVRILRQIEERTGTYYNQHGVQLTNQQLAGEMGLTEKQIARIQSRGMVREVEEDNSANLADDGVNIAEMVENAMLAEQLNLAIRQLSEKQKKVVLLLRQGLKQSQIAAALDTTEAHVSYLRKTAIADIRRQLIITEWF